MPTGRDDTTLIGVGARRRTTSIATFSESLNDSGWDQRTLQCPRFGRRRECGMSGRKKLVFSRSTLQPGKLSIVSAGNARNNTVPKDLDEDPPAAQYNFLGPDDERCG
jgi:hypothetical protein